MDYCDIDKSVFSAVARAIDAAQFGEKSKVVAHYAGLHRISPSKLWREIRALGRDTQRKTRSDKGKSVLALDTTVALSGMLKAGTRDNAKQALKLPTAVSILASNGVPIDCSLSTVARALRNHKLDAATQARQTPHTEQRSLHPNHVHMVDPSLCLLFYMKGKQYLIDEKEFYGNKLESLANNPKKVWRYVLVDHFSACISVRYYEAKGEDTRTLADFLLHCWGQVNGRATFGVPQVLVMDQGPGNKSHVIKNLCEGLEVKLILHSAGNPRAKGSAEVSNNIIEMQFETRLRFQTVDCVEELNAFAADWQQAFNADLVPFKDCKLNRNGMTFVRMDLYREIKPHQIRQLPPIDQCLLFMHGKTEERQVNGKLQISFKHPAAARTQAYDLRGLKGVNRGDKVVVKALAYGDCAVLVVVEAFDGSQLTHRLLPIADYGAGGFRMNDYVAVIGENYVAQPKTDIDRAADAADRAAFGIDADGVILSDDEIAVAKAKKAKPFAHLNDGKGLLSLSTLNGIKHPLEMPKRGTVIDSKIVITPEHSQNLSRSGHALSVPSHISLPVVRIDHVQMAQAMVRALGDDWSAEKFALITEWYPDGCLDQELDGLAERFKRFGRMVVVK